MGMACESLMKTLKYEEVCRSEYRDLAEARASIGQFLERICMRPINSRENRLIIFL